VTKEHEKRVIRLSLSSHSGGGEVRVVHQNHEDEKNTSEFFEVNTEAPRSVINWYF